MIKGKTVGLIAAVDAAGMIGYDGGIPWKNSVDLKRFKALTMGTTLVMGRTTYEGLPPSKLPGRHKHVLSSKPQEPSTDTKWYASILQAIEDAPTNMVWIAGGAKVYQEAILLNIPDFIDLSIINGVTLTSIQDSIAMQREKTVKMPPITYFYQVVSETANPEDPNLFHRKYIIRPNWAWKEITAE